MSHRSDELLAGAIVRRFDVLGAELVEVADDGHGQTEQQGIACPKPLGESTPLSEQVKCLEGLGNHKKCDFLSPGRILKHQSDATEKGGWPGYVGTIHISCQVLEEAE